MGLSKVQNAARAKFIGKDPTGYSSHSFRRFAATQAVDQGGTEALLKRFFRWKNSSTLQYIYLQESSETNN